MISSAQIRAGRALINAKQTELASAAGISLATLNNIERGLGDPRASTLQSIEDALSVAGVQVDKDISSETVTLHKYSRPTAYDSFAASQRVLDILGSDPLIKIDSLLFYVREVSGAAHVTEQMKDHRVCLLISGKVRKILFDQVGFSLANSARVAEVAGVLLAASVTFPKGVYFCNKLLEDTTLSTLEDSVRALENINKVPLLNPKEFFSVIGDWEELFEPNMHVKGHPLKDLLAYLNHINHVG